MKNVIFVACKLSNENKQYAAVYMEIQWQYVYEI